MTDYLKTRKDAAKMTAKKWSAKERKCIVTERKCSYNDTGEIFYYISRVIIIHYAAWSDNTSIFMSIYYHLLNELLNEISLITKSWKKLNLNFMLFLYMLPGILVHSFKYLSGLFMRLQREKNN